MPTLVQTLESLVANTSVETAGLQVLGLLAGVEGYTVTAQDISDFQTAATTLVGVVNRVLATKSAAKAS